MKHKPLDKKKENISTANAEQQEQTNQSDGTKRLTPPTFNVSASVSPQKEEEEEKVAQEKEKNNSGFADAGSPETPPADNNAGLSSFQLRTTTTSNNPNSQKSGNHPYQLNNAPSGNNKIPEEVQSKMENVFQADFSEVNIQQNSEEAKNMGAYAFTKGNEIHFAAGQYNPESEEGQELLGHELSHVVQQRDGDVKPTTQEEGMPVNEDATLEKEADDMGKKAAKGTPPSGGNPNPGTNNSAKSNLTIQKKDKGDGQFLDTELRLEIEKETGADLGLVRVRTDQTARNVCETFGKDIHVDGFNIYINTKKINLKKAEGKNALRAAVLEIVALKNPTAESNQIEHTYQVTIDEMRAKMKKKTGEAAIWCYEKMHAMTPEARDRMLQEHPSLIANILEKLPIEFQQKQDFGFQDGIQTDFAKSEGNYTTADGGPNYALSILTDKTTWEDQEMLGLALSILAQASLATNEQLKTEVLRIIEAYYTEPSLNTLANHGFTLNGGRITYTPVESTQLYNPEDNKEGVFSGYGYNAVKKDANKYIETENRYVDIKLEEAKTKLAEANASGVSGNDLAAYQEDVRILQMLVDQSKNPSGVDAALHLKTESKKKLTFTELSLYELQDTNLFGGHVAGLRVAQPENAADSRITYHANANEGIARLLAASIPFDSINYPATDYVFRTGGGFFNGIDLKLNWEPRGKGKDKKDDNELSKGGLVASIDSLEFNNLRQIFPDVTYGIGKIALQGLKIDLQQTMGTIENLDGGEEIMTRLTSALTNMSSMLTVIIMSVMDQMSPDPASNPTEDLKQLLTEDFYDGLDLGLSFASLDISNFFSTSQGKIGDINAGATDINVKSNSAEGSESSDTNRVELMKERSNLAEAKGKRDKKKQERHKFDDDILASEKRIDELEGEIKSADADNSFSFDMKSESLKLENAQLVDALVKSSFAATLEPYGLKGIEGLGNLSIDGGVSMKSQLSGEGTTGTVIGISQLSVPSLTSPKFHFDNGAYSILGDNFTTSTLKVDLDILVRDQAAGQKNGDITIDKILVNSVDIAELGMDAVHLQKKSDPENPLKLTGKSALKGLSIKNLEVAPVNGEYAVDSGSLAIHANSFETNSISKYIDDDFKSGKGWFWISGIDMNKSRTEIAPTADGKGQIVDKTSLSLGTGDGEGKAGDINANGVSGGMNVNSFNVDYSNVRETELGENDTILETGNNHDLVDINFDLGSINLKKLALKNDSVEVRTFKTKENTNNGNVDLTGVTGKMQIKQIPDPKNPGQSKIEYIDVKSLKANAVDGSNIKVIKDGTPYTISGPAHLDGFELQDMRLDAEMAPKIVPGGSVSLQNLDINQFNIGKLAGFENINAGLIKVGRLTGKDGEGDGGGYSYEVNDLGIDQVIGVDKEKNATSGMTAELGAGTDIKGEYMDNGLLKTKVDIPKRLALPNISIVTEDGSWIHSYANDEVYLDNLSVDAQVKMNPDNPKEIEYVNITSLSLEKLSAAGLVIKTEFKGTKVDVRLPKDLPATIKNLTMEDFHYDMKSKVMTGEANSEEIFAQNIGLELKQGVKDYIKMTPSLSASSFHFEAFEDGSKEIDLANPKTWMDHAQYDDYNGNNGQLDPYLEEGQERSNRVFADGYYLNFDDAEGSQADPLFQAGNVHVNLPGENGKEGTSTIISDPKLGRVVIKGHLAGSSVSQEDLRFNNLVLGGQVDGDLKISQRAHDFANKELGVDKDMAQATIIEAPNGTINVHEADIEIRRDYLKSDDEKTEEHDAQQGLTGDYGFLDGASGMVTINLFGEDITLSATQLHSTEQNNPDAAYVDLEQFVSQLATVWDNNTSEWDGSNWAIGDLNIKQDDGELKLNVQEVLNQYLFTLIRTVETNDVYSFNDRNWVKLSKLVDTLINDQSPDTKLEAAKIPSESSWYDPLVENHVDKIVRDIYTQIHGEMNPQISMDMNIDLEGMTPEQKGLLEFMGDGNGGEGDQMRFKLKGGMDQTMQNGRKKFGPQGTFTDVHIPYFKKQMIDEEKKQMNGEVEVDGIDIDEISLGADYMTNRFEITSPYVKAKAKGLSINGLKLIKRIEEADAK